MTHPTQARHSQPDEGTEEQLVEAARLYVQQLPAFYVHAAVFAAGMVARITIHR